jgi:hypothetical protein
MIRTRESEFEDSADRRNPNHQESATMFHRLRPVAAGAVLVMSASLTVATTATAEPSAPALVATAAKEKRIINIKGIEPRPNLFIVKGRVFPAYEKKPAIMQRKLKSAKKWRTWKRFKTNGKSRYRQRIAPLQRRGTVCYRVKVKGNKKFKNSFSARVCIKTF